jgi:hypothetical protein
VTNHTMAERIALLEFQLAATRLGGFDSVE